MYMMGAFDDEDEELDIYDALGLNTPPPAMSPMQTGIDDPLAAFMDDDDEDEVLASASWVLNSPDDDVENSVHFTPASIEELIATLARELLDEEKIQTVLEGGKADFTSLKVQRDRDAYHLSLIIDMGGHHIKPFATVLAVEDEWKALTAPHSLPPRWKPLYDTLCHLLASALKAHGRPSTL